ncbi:AAA family ATPase [Sagittula sp. NFXS13]|uniref:AAA family ATPase n=1 Tax=Sagittula sp. NFXS13 TaxID=2819095 RepID=UPI0032E041C0
MGAPERYEVEDRLKKFLANFRAERDPARSLRHIPADDRDKIERRVIAYFEAVHRASGMGHLDRRDREKMEAFRGGLDLIEIKSEHQADEIASALHTEMPWMAAATERVWHDLRSSVRRGDAGPRISPLLLVGPPGIGKSHWARLLGEHIGVPTTTIEATSEPASFAVSGSQRGWSSAEPGKAVQSVMASRIANPVIVVDEIEKAGSPQSTSGRSFDLAEGLLPLLERTTAQGWACPYFRVKFDMSWIIWVLTANSLQGLTQPFLSRCPPLELSSLSLEHLKGFAAREGARRGLPIDGVDAVQEVIDAIRRPQLLSLRNVLRLLDAVEVTVHQPVLH